MPSYTFTDGVAPSASTWNANVRDQVVTQCTSGTRPSSPVEGQMIHESDTDRIYFYSGSAWVILTEPLQTWTPTITQSVTVTGTVNRGWYRRQNGLFEARLSWTSTGAGTATNTIRITTPVTLANTNDAGGSFVVVDSGTTVYAGSVTPINTTTFELQVSGNANSLGNTPGMTLAANDIIRVTLFGSY